jgi:hypothetical protein
MQQSISIRKVLINSDSKVTILAEFSAKSKDARDNTLN